MEIRMAGIESGTASLEQREALAFTKSESVRGMQAAGWQPGITGCVIYSTCNRTELWLSTDSSDFISPAEMLCAFKSVPLKQAAGVITERSGAEAVRYLFETACGLHSRIWGEDQIITQIKEAIHLANDSGTAGKILAKLFQTAVTSAKRVKTEVRFSSGTLSVAAAAAEKCREQYGHLKGLHCLVIGSGKMGRRAAEELAKNGACVCMTIRQYKYGISIVPEHCKSIPYSSRLKEAAESDVILSATSSPHYTLLYEPIAEMCAKNQRERLFLDLAVPRDIEPDVANLPKCRLVTIDDLCCRVRSEEKAKTEQRCRQIIDHYIAEFKKQLAAWSSLPAIRSFSAEASSNAVDLLDQEWKAEGLSDEMRERLRNTAQKIIREKTASALFSFRDWTEENAEKFPQDSTMAAVR